MPLPKRPAAPTRETIVAPAAGPVYAPTGGQVDKAADGGKIPTYSVRGVDPALALAVKHAALDLGLTMREAQEAMMRDWLRKYGKEATP